MNAINPLRKLDQGRQAWARPAYRILGRAHVSVSELFAASSALGTARRKANSSPRGRNSVSEVDILRSAIVMTSAGLDASMKLLVNEAGRELISRGAVGACAAYRQHLKREMSKPRVSDSFRQAVLADDPGKGLLKFYLRERTKASFQGSGDLVVRVKGVLGISNSEVPDSVLEQLKPFFEARNKIVHEMDLEDPEKKKDSVKRVHRYTEVVARQCNEVFEVAVLLIRGASSECWRAGSRRK